MNILVPLKRVIDPYVKIKLKADGTAVETEQIKMSINPFDEIALEEALRLKEKGQASAVIVVSIGDHPVQETLRTALALGADEAIHIATTAVLSCLSIAKILCAVARQREFGLILLGKQAIDDDSAQVGPMLATLLEWPFASFASAVTCQGTSVDVHSEVDGGLSTVSLDLPTLISTDLRLNTPRYATLPNIMKAKTKPLSLIPLEDLALDLKEQTSSLGVYLPPQRQAGQKLASMKMLVQKLREEKVLP